MDAKPGSSVRGISQVEYWSALPFPSPQGLPDPGIESTSLISPSLAGGLFTTMSPGKSILYSICQSHSQFIPPRLYPLNGNLLWYSCLENPHAQRSLAGYSPWCCKELDTIERLTLSLQFQTQGLLNRKSSTTVQGLHYRRVEVLLLFSMDTQVSDPTGG